MTLTQLLPSFDPQAAAAHPEWLPAGTTDGAGHAFLSLHSWLVHLDGKVILIDAGSGNDKSRPDQKLLDHLDDPFLAELEKAGVSPGAVDYVVHTHIHSDHVGWNTRLENGAWVPTFPKAVTICSAREWRYGAALTDGDESAAERERADSGLGKPVRNPVSGTFADSMRPLESTGRLRLIATGGEEVMPGLQFIATTGHSIDHASIEIESDGELALFGGDVLHHPIEIYDTGLVSCFCEFPEAVPGARRTILDRAAERKATYFSSHFPRSSAGLVARAGAAYTWQFLEGA